MNIRFGGGVARALVIVAIVLAAILHSAPSSSRAAATAKPATQTAEEFKQRLAVCPINDVPARLELASWAMDNLLFDESEQVYRQLLLLHPENSDAFHGLWEAAGHRKLERDSSTLQTAREALSKQFLQYESKRFVVLSDARPAWTRAQLDLLERTAHQFQRVTSKLKLHPLPQQNKLVCVLFSNRDDYQQFAKTQDNVTNVWITGYYSPRNDWVVFYDSQSSPEVAEAREKLQEMSDQIETLNRQVRTASFANRTDEANRLRQDLTRRQTHFEQQRNRVDDFAQQESTATTIHEATHQLLFHSRIKSSQVRYPLWICEGLATNFETDKPQQAFGPEYDYPPRRDRFTLLLQSGQLISLKTLIAMDRFDGQSDAQIEKFYSESYALVMWMYRFRKSELRSYLISMLGQPTGEPDASQHVELFEQAFGHTEAIERAWLRFEHSQIKPSATVASSGETIAPR